jgi:hypothetical protein
MESPYREKCLCEWEGWNLTEQSLPNRDGIYLTRYSEDGDCYEKQQLFTVISRKDALYGAGNSVKCRWQEEFYTGVHVYAWKENHTCMR